MPAQRPSTILAAVVLTVTLVACGSTSSSPPARPATAATLVIVSPTPNQVTGPDVTLQFQVIGGTVLPAAQVKGPLRGDQGHIHVSLDGKLVQMAYSTQTQLTGLTPGPHAVQASWVAVDHLPFSNQVLAVVLFRVSG
ncbi:MAG: hypothetical protein ACYDH6_04555 [Acidimicrobiales bacterium]